MTEPWHNQRLRGVGVLFAVVILLMVPTAALAQSVPVTVEVEGADPSEPTDEPTGTPTDPSSEPTTDDPSTTDPGSPQPPPGDDPPPAAVEPPDDPLPRTGADLFRTVRDAAALIAAGLLLLIATRKPETRKPGRTRG